MLFFFLLEVGSGNKGNDITENRFNSWGINKCKTLNPCQIIGNCNHLTINFCYY